MYQQICSSIQWIVILFCWWFPLLCKKFLVWYLFFLLSTLPEHLYQKKVLLHAMSEILLSLFSSRIFMASGLTFKSLIHFEFTLVCVVRRCLVLFFKASPYCFPQCMHQYASPAIGEKSSPFSTSSPALVVYWFIDDGHSDWCEVISHCSFNLHFSDD